VRDFDEDHTFDCVDDPPARESQWYTVCGKPHTNFPLWMTSISLLAALGVLVFSWLLRPSRHGARRTALIG
jgi:hypothetical protein